MQLEFINHSSNSSLVGLRLLLIMAVTDSMGSSLQSVKAVFSFSAHNEKKISEPVSNTMYVYIPNKEFVGSPEPPFVSLATQPGGSRPAAARFTIVNSPHYST